MVRLRALGIGQVERIDAELVGHGHVGVVGHALGDPVMAADGLEPPDLVDIRKTDAVRLVGAVLLKERAKAANAVACRGDIGQNDRHQVLFAQAAGTRGNIAGLAFRTLGGNIFDERVGAEHTLVGGDGLGCRHGDVQGIETGLGPHAVTRQHVGHARVAHRVIGQGHGEVRDLAHIGARLVLGLDHGHALGLEHAVGRILVARHDRRAIVAGGLADENSGAGHTELLCGAVDFPHPSVAVLAACIMHLQPGFMQKVGVQARHRRSAGICRLQKMRLVTAQLCAASCERHADDRAEHHDKRGGRVAPLGPALGMIDSGRATSACHAAPSALRQPRRAPRPPR